MFQECCLNLSLKPSKQENKFFFRVIPHPQSLFVSVPPHFYDNPHTFTWAHTLPYKPDRLHQCCAENNLIFLFIETERGRTRKYNNNKSSRRAFVFGGTGSKTANLCTVLFLKLNSCCSSDKRICWQQGTTTKLCLLARYSYSYILLLQWKVCRVFGLIKTARSC